MAVAKPQEGPIEGHAYVAGLDWALSVDYTVLVVIDVTDNIMVRLRNDQRHRIRHATQPHRSGVSAF